MDQLKSLLDRLAFAAQPIFHASTRKITGYEVLARLLDDRGEINDSAQFLVDLSFNDRLVVEHTIVQRIVGAVAANQVRVPAPGAPLSINVTLEYLAEWVPMLISTLDHIDRSRLVFELVEPSYVDAHVDDLEAVRILQAHGWHFMLDDIVAADQARSILDYGLTPLGLKVEKGLAPDDLQAIQQLCIRYGIGTLVGERYEEPDDTVTHIQSLAWGKPERLELSAEHAPILREMG